MRKSWGLSKPKGAMKVKVACGLGGILFLRRRRTAGPSRPIRR